MNLPSRPQAWNLILLAGLAAMLPACAQNGEPGEDDAVIRQAAELVALGPKDGFDLPPTDLQRVAVGTAAPDFSLRTLAGDTLTLSDFRGEKEVILVFYRGHW